MTDNETNTTLEYDYTGYYYDTGLPSPCPFFLQAISMVLLLVSHILRYNGTNATGYDYSDYYETDLPSPCDNVDLQNFNHTFLPILYSLVFIFGLIGNGLVMCVLVKHRKQTNLTDICLLNLAVSDLLFVIVLPFFAHYAAVGQRWAFGVFMCRFVSGCHHVGFFGSIFFMIAMTVDRYVAIVHTHTAARYRTTRAALTLSVLVWLLSVFISLPFVIFFQVTPADGGNGPVCVYEPDSDAWIKYDVFTMSILGLMIPLLVMMGCYFKIICVLVNTRNKRYHYVVRLIICIVAAFFLFWAPYNITVFVQFLLFVGILKDDCGLRTNLHLSVILTETIAYSHCCLNPIIYAFVGQKFMKRAKKMLGKWLSCIPLPLNRDSSESSFSRSSVTSQSSDDNSVVM